MAYMDPMGYNHQIVIGTVHYPFSVLLPTHNPHVKASPPSRLSCWWHFANAPFKRGTTNRKPETFRDPGSLTTLLSSQNRRSLSVFCRVTLTVGFGTATGGWASLCECHGNWLESQLHVPASGLYHNCVTVCHSHPQWKAGHIVFESDNGGSGLQWSRSLILVGIQVTKFTKISQDSANSDIILLQNDSK